MIPKNMGIAQKGTQKSRSNPKVPKIMAHPRIMTYASYHTSYADQGKFALDVVFTMILCTTNFFIW